MKTFLISALLLASPVSAFAATPVKSPRVYSFSVDQRLVDGLYQRLLLKKNAEGAYTLSHRVITPGFGSPITDTTEVLGEGLICEETKEGRILETLFCSIDMRPADGLLTEITFNRDEFGTYTATLHESAYGTLIGPGFDETTELATGLKLKK